MPDANAARSAEPAAAQLVLGPLLRYTGTTSATVWVETDRPTAVEVLGHRMPTFQVEGHHYALVLVEGLAPGTVTEYEVRLGGTGVWPPGDGRPPSTIRTRRGEQELRLIFGSCRIGAPVRPSASDDFGIDALWAYSRKLQAAPADWPDALMLMGDQVYADEVSPETAAFIRGRRDVRKPPGEEIADFEEYTRLYREAWSDPDIRWLLSTVPSTMIFDDHDVNDDWNISESWVEEMRSLPWWDDRITGAFMSYWLYQHLGNLSPPELAADEFFRLVQADEDAGPRLREAARRWDRESAATRWTYDREFGRSRLLVIDSRAARILTDGRREMIDADEWDWIVDRTRGSFDHLIVVSTLPVFLAHGIHHLEAWNEAVCDGAWGRLAAWLGERLRRAVDLEHWAAFHDSFERLAGLLRTVSHGNEGAAPSTIVLLGGDVHTTYVMEVALSEDAGPSRVHQVVCSPLRNPLSPLQRRIVRVTSSRPFAAVFSRLARACGVRPTAVEWDFLRGPSFDNAIGELELEERSARVTIRRSGSDAYGEPVLSPLYSALLSDDSDSGR